MSESPKILYTSPELRTYGTLRELTQTASGTGQDDAGSCSPGQGCHNSGKG